MEESKALITDSEIQVCSDQLHSAGERFKSFEENILPLELEHKKESYMYILNKIAEKTRDLIRYREFYQTYESLINKEAREINRLESEVTSFEQACQKNSERATQA